MQYATIRYTVCPNEYVKKSGKKVGNTISKNMKTWPDKSDLSNRFQLVDLVAKSVR